MYFKTFAPFGPCVGRRVPGAAPGRPSDRAVHAGYDLQLPIAHTTLSMPQPETPASAPPETFEQALAELEALVARMEEGKLPLEESLAAYQRGAELIRYCESRLADAQARIAILDGEVLRDFNPGSK